MDATRKSFFNWSGGKDSALALYHTLRDAGRAPELLLTNVNKAYRRVSMHGVREELVEKQATAIGIPLQKLLLNEQPSMVEYEASMRHVLTDLVTKGFTHAVFGDIFLDDLRQYREARLSELGIKAEFPLWKRDTTELVHEFIELGFKTIVVCTKAEVLDKSFVGRVIDEDFLKDLPAGVDPCGENGEFHSFVFDGPIFRHPVPFSIGEKVFREYQAPKSTGDNCFSNQPFQPSIGFWFCDLLAEL
jgi:uncharacterized protein (TIGR00290 family)